MRILVVGGAGYIGSNTVRRLLEEKHKVFVFDDLSTGYREFVPKEAIFFKGDLKKNKDIEHFFKKHKVGAVMHFAASALVNESVVDPLKYYENNVSACVNLLKAMIVYRVKYFIFSSTCATFGEPKRIPIEAGDDQKPVNPYGWSKFMIEKILEDISKTGQIRYAALRYFNACGAHASATIGERHVPETHLIPNILKVITGEKKELSIFGDDYDTSDGSCVRDYIHIEDLASAHLMALKALKRGMPSSAFNLGSEHGYSVKEIVQAVERVTGKKVRSKTCPRRAGDPARLIGSSEKARRILGWRPKYDLPAIIQSAWEWEKKEAIRGPRQKF